MKNLKLYGPFLFMDGVQLSQGYRATTRRQLTVDHSGVLGSNLINLRRMVG